jgi:hypothetical protein
MQSLRMPMTESAPESGKPLGVFARLRRALAPSEEEWLEEARRRMRSKPGFISSLSPEVLEMLRQNDDIDIMGGPAPKRSDP